MKTQVNDGHDGRTSFNVLKATITWTCAHHRVACMRSSNRGWRAGRRAGSIYVKSCRRAARHTCCRRPGRHRWSPGRSRGRRRAPRAATATAEAVIGAYRIATALSYPATQQRRSRRTIRRTQLLCNQLPPSQLGGGNGLTRVCLFGSRIARKLMGSFS